MPVRWGFLSPLLCFLTCLISGSCSFIIHNQRAVLYVMLIVLQDHRELRTPIPCRADFPSERGLLLVAGAVHRIKDVFFALVQSEMGDLYMVCVRSLLQCFIRFFSLKPMPYPWKLKPPSP